MPKDKFIKTVLVLILILLCLNLLKGNLASPLLYIEAKAKPESDEGIQLVDISEISGIACSADGKFVYVAGEFYDREEKAHNMECIVRSDNFGKSGSWQIVAKEKTAF
ncbi:hypothetical protein JW879_03840 [candidate division WOR-3 bacterium]|nr:hypothetical protein [candidate division WOR-3 bacterium]